MSKKDGRQFAVLGLGRFGLSIARTLSENGYDVLVVDNNHERVQEASEYVTHAVVADISDERALRTIGLGNFDVVIMARAEKLESTILGTLLAKELGVKQILSRANNDTEARILKKIGADRIISPEVEMGERIAYNLISGNFLEILELSSEYSIVEIHPLAEWIGNNLADISVRSKLKLNIIAIRRSESVIAMIEPSLKIEADDVLIAVGDRKSIQDFMKKNAEKPDGERHE